MRGYFPAQLIVGVIPGYPLNIPFPFSFGDKFNYVRRLGPTPRLVGCYALLYRRMEDIKGGMIFAIFSPELVLYHNKLKWIPSPTSPLLKSPPITTVEAPEAMLTALSPTPPPLTPPPIWMAEALEATLTALLPKCLLNSYHCPIIIVRSPCGDILDRFTEFFLPFHRSSYYDCTSFFALLHEFGLSPSRVHITYAAFERLSTSLYVVLLAKKGSIFDRQSSDLGGGAGDGSNMMILE